MTAGKIQGQGIYRRSCTLSAECFRSDTNLAKDYGVYGLEIIPVVVYASIQPLSIDRIRHEEGVNCDALVRTTDELCEMLSKPDFG